MVNTDRSSRHSEELYLQCIGTTMGSKMAPQYTTLVWSDGCPRSGASYLHALTSSSLLPVMVPFEGREKYCIAQAPRKVIEARHLTCLASVHNQHALEPFI